MRTSFSQGPISDDARRLLSCIIGSPETTGNLSHEAVSALEMHLLRRGWPVGESLGAIPDVQKSLGIGRPACREAMIILEARGLLDVRRGPGGGLFVAAPMTQDVVRAMLMYLSLSQADRRCVQEFRLLVWRMVVEAALQHGLTVDRKAESGWAVDLAQQAGNPAMILVAQIAECLVQSCGGRPAAGPDAHLDEALRTRDLNRAFQRLDELSDQTRLSSLEQALESMEGSFSKASGRKSAMALAARLVREEMVRHPEKPEAEWETADRLGCSDAVVRQARRILQDFGVVHCQRGRKGAIWGVPASPGGVIRLLAPCMMTSGASAEHSAEVANFLACNGPRLAATRASTSGFAPARFTRPGVSNGDFVDLIETENLILALAGNPLLSMMTRALGLANLLSTTMCISLSRRAELARINQRILRAIETGDAVSANTLARTKGEIQKSEATYLQSA